MTEQNPNACLTNAENSNSPPQTVSDNKVDQQDNPASKIPNSNVTRRHLGSELLPPNVQSPAPSASSSPDEHAEHLVQTTNSNEQQPMSFSQTVQANTHNQVRTQRIIRMKVVPPFRRQHFQNANLLQTDIENAMRETLNIFQPIHRRMVTIARTNIPQPGQRHLQLMVTAPIEAENEVARAKLTGVKKNGKNRPSNGRRILEIYQQ